MPTGSGRFLIPALAVWVAEVGLGLHGRPPAPVLLGLVTAVVALFAGGFVWVLRAPGKRRVRTLRGIEWRLGPEGTRRFGVVFASLWLLLVTPAVLSEPHSFFFWLFAAFGVIGGVLVAASGGRVSRQAPSPRLRQELAARQRRWLPRVLLGIAGLSFAVPALVLYLEGARNPWVYVVFSGLPGMIAGYVALRVLRSVERQRPRPYRPSGNGPVRSDRSQWIAAVLLVAAVLVLIYRDDIETGWARFGSRDQVAAVASGAKGKVPAAAPPSSRPVPSVDVPAAPSGWQVVPAVPEDAAPVVLSAWLARPWRLGQSGRSQLLRSHSERCWLDPADYPGEGVVHYGRIRLGAVDHCVAVSGWDSRDPWLWVDADGDGRFGDPGGIYRNQGNGRLAAEVRLPMPDPRLGNNPRNRDYRLWVWVQAGQERTLWLAYYPTTELETHARLPGAETRVLAVVAERAGGIDGDFSDDGVYLDLDADGKVADGEYVPPGGGLRGPDGRLWRVQVRLP